MTSRFIVRLTLAAFVLLSACTSGESAILSDSGDPSIVASTSALPAAGENPGNSNDEATPSDDGPLGDPDVIFDGSTGGEEAADAVRGLLGSMNSGDVLGALAYIDPAERDLIADLYVTAVETSSAEWPQFGGDRAIADLGVEVLPLSQLRTTVFADHLAWVETDEVEFYMAAPTEVAASVFSDTEPWGPGSGYTRDEIAHREDDWSGFTDLFGGSSNVLPGLMVTELDGRWYVSFGRTILELLRVDGEFETDFPSQRTVVDTTPSVSPEQAVTDFLQALADGRMTAAASHLVPSEGQAFGDYPAMLEKWLPGVLDFDIDLEPAALSVVHREGNRAVVEIAELGVRLVGVEHDEGEFDTSDVAFEYDLRLADRCLSVNNEDLWCSQIDEYATAFTSFYSELGWDGLRFVAVESDGGWSISLYESVAHYGLPVLSDPLYGLAYSQFIFSTFEGPIGYTLVNETAKTLPVQTTGSIILEPHARNRVLIARIETSEEGQTLQIDPSYLDRECDITMWNTDMVTNDWGEEPEHYANDDCDDHAARPLEIPADVELTITLWGYGENLEPATVELR